VARSAKPVVIITGVSSGIGLACAKLFSAKGWLVVGSIRSREVSELRTLAIDIQTAEMSNPDDIGRLVERAVKTYGRIDAVISNAGYGLIGRIEDMEYEAVEAAIRVNLLATIWLCRSAMRAMKRQRKGVIIAVSSIAGIVGIPNYSVYVAGKYGIEGLMESLWFESRGTGVRVKLIEPSVTNTPFWSDRSEGGGINRPTAKVITGIGKGLSAEAVAKVVYKAATGRSNRLRYPVGFTGQVILWRRLLPSIFFRSIMREFFR
jgi:NAD(P)-dependent dehydrogenase (short-subunit alcohol dehydrogenase family)